MKQAARTLWNLIRATSPSMAPTRTPLAMKGIQTNTISPQKPYLSILFLFFCQFLLLSQPQLCLFQVFFLFSLTIPFFFFPLPFLFSNLGSSHYLSWGICHVDEALHGFLEFLVFQWFHNLPGSCLCFGFVWLVWVCPERHQQFNSFELLIFDS